MRNGQRIGLTDQLLRDICVGDVVKDAQGVEYSIDRYGRAKPLNGGNEIPVRQLVGCEISKAYAESSKPAQAPYPDFEELSEEEQTLADIRKFSALAGDQTLVEELRGCGWTVTCTKTVEKIVYEEVSI